MSATAYVACLIAVLAMPANALANAAKHEAKPDRHAATPPRLGDRTERKGGQQLIELTIEKGDSLFEILGRPDLQILNRTAALRALDDVHDPHHLQPGDKVRLVLENKSEGSLVRSLHIESGHAEDLTVDIMVAKASASALSAKSELAVHEASGVVGASFRQSLQKLALPRELADEALTAFQYDPDMPSPLAAGARFSIIYETTTDGAKPVRSTLKYIAIDDGRKTHRVYRYHMENGDPVYVQDSGRGVAPLHFGKPIKTDLVTSPYGWRTHPVFGDLRFHKGVDFGAPKGTPVVAAADGKITDAGWRGNYGNYIRIDHGPGIATAYAHLGRFAKGVASSKSVHKGQVIGYVGTTGIATGPHLYYEVIMGGEQIDPFSLPSMIPIHLAGRSLVNFKAYTSSFH
jgi:murein DD-endopeptidase MepM/ murein hydrolase activator NlpD